MNRHPLAPLLMPSSIAIVGASEDAASVGAALAGNLSGSFAGSVFLVNAHRDTIHGSKAYRSIADLPEAPDLALIATPAETVAGVIEDCGRRGVRAAVILSSGLGAGSADGAQYLARIAACAAQHRLRILGPNSLGIMRPALGLNATFASSQARSGSVALVAQSGAMVSAVLDWADADELGFSSVISLGNKLDVDFADVLDFLTLDPATESIVLYVEGIRNARKFMSALRAAARSKPVIVLKAGRDAAGSRAAATHSSAMAGRDDVVDVALRRAGAVRVRTFVQLFSAAKCLSSRYRPTGNRLAVVTNGGGPGVMAADRADGVGIEVARLSPQTLARLDQTLPPGWSRDNPVDLLEDANVERYREAVAACMEDPGVDGLLVILAPQAMTRTDDIARAVVDLTRQNGKHLFACWMGDRSVQRARKLLADARIPTFRTPEPAVEAFANIATYYQNQRLLMQVPGPLAHSDAPDMEGAREVAASAMAQNRALLNEVESKAMLACFRIAVAQTVLARSPTEAIMVAEQIGFPVAMKVSSPEVSHKRAVGGVRLNVSSAREVRSSYEEIRAAVAGHLPAAPIDGVTLQPMVTGAGTREVMLGLFTDEAFGPVITFSAGGSDVELIADRAVALPPLNEFLAETLIEKTRIGRLLKAELTPAGFDALVGLLLRVSEMACELPWLRAMDVNPVIVGAAGSVAVDARIEIAPTPEASRYDRYAHMAIHPYPSHLTRQHVLPDGIAVTLRAIRPEDAAMERAFVRNLSEESKYFRFISALRELSERMLVRFTQIDYDREMALIAVVEENGADLEIGVARYAINPDHESCEFALVVADRWHGRGIATMLMNALMEAARDKGLVLMEGVVLHNNDKMLRLMRRLGFEIRPEAEDPSLRQVVKRLA
jgi:acetyltransferase